MTFDEWLQNSGIDDVTAGRLFKRHRTHISKLRRGIAKPSYDFMVAVREASGGKVDLESWAPDRLARAG
jgi:hypothetical protein